MIAREHVTYLLVLLVIHGLIHSHHSSNMFLNSNFCFESAVPQRSNAKPKPQLPFAVTAAAAISQLTY